MAIPGITPDLPVRAKVRIGEKKVSAKGKEYPAAADHFICDDPSFLSVVGTNAKTLRVILPFAQPEQNFSTGLEWWRGKQLTCYSKGEGSPPLAYRVTQEVKDWDTVRGAVMGRDRTPVTCAVRDCVFLKDKACKPMGRLQFFIDGIDRAGGVYQIDTKSWNTIEKIESFLTVLGDPRERVLLLTVEMVQKGRDKYPVISLEADLEVNTLTDVAVADAYVAAAKLIDKQGNLADGYSVDDARVALADLLEVTRPGWRQKPEFIERIKEVGVVPALAVMVKDWS